MFTGLIRDVGVVRSWQRRSDSAVFSIATKLPKKHLDLGASVCCNGACLTVVDVKSDSIDPQMNEFIVEAGPQTLALTRLGQASFSGAGELINLEPALRMGDALGGHVVSGHVDTLGVVLVNEPTADGFWRLRVGFEQRFAHYLVKKGSIAIAGVSLTVAELSQASAFDSWAEIMLIPHTLEQTNLRALKPGSPIELEFDTQAKLVAELLRVMLPEQLKSMIQKN